MSIIARAAAPLVKAFAPGEVPHDRGGGYAWVLPANEDYSRRVGDPSNSSIVGTLIQWFFRTFPEAPFRVWQEDAEGARVPIIPHDLSALIKRPNDYYDDDVLWSGSIISDIVDGNFYWLKARNNANRVVELWYVPHFLMEPKGSKDGTIFIEYYEYKVNGKRFEVPPSEVVHVRNGVDPQNPRKGMSPIKGQLREIYTDEEAALFSAALLKNVGVLSLIVSPKSETAEFDPEDAKKEQTKFEANYGGVNRGRVIFMSGATQVEEVGFSPEQLTLRDVRSIPEERLSAAVGVPAAVAGLGTGLAQTKVGATMHELRELAAEQALVPMWKRFAKGAGRSLLPEFSTGKKGIVAGFDIREVRVLQPDRQLLHERVRDDFKAAIIPRSTAQSRLGYPIDPQGDIYLQSGLVVEVPASTPRPKGAKDRPAPQRKRATRSTFADRFIKACDLGRLNVEDSFARAVIVPLVELGDEAERVFVQVEKRIPVAAGKGNGSKADLDDERIVNNILERLGLNDIRDGSLKPIYAVHYRTASEMVGNVYESMGSTLSIGTRDEVAERLIAAGGRHLGMLDLREETKRALFSALSDARAAGLSMDATGRLIREYVPAGRFNSAGAKYRSELIARTETRYATNLSVAEVGVRAGFTSFIAYDNRTGFDDDQCSARDGEVFESEGMINVIGDEHPGGTLSFSPEPRT